MNHIQQHSKKKIQTIWIQREFCNWILQMRYFRCKGCQRINIECHEFAHLLQSQLWMNSVNYDGHCWKNKQIEIWKKSFVFFTHLRSKDPCERRQQTVQVLFTSSSSLSSIAYTSNSYYHSLRLVFSGEWGNFFVNNLQVSFARYIHEEGDGKK